MRCLPVPQCGCAMSPDCQRSNMAAPRISLQCTLQTSVNLGWTPWEPSPKSSCFSQPSRLPHCLFSPPFSYARHPETFPWLLNILGFNPFFKTSSFISFRPDSFLHLEIIGPSCRPHPAPQSSPTFLVLGTPSSSLECFSDWKGNK